MRMSVKGKILGVVCACLAVAGVPFWVQSGRIMKRNMAIESKAQTLFSEARAESDFEIDSILQRRPMTSVQHRSSLESALQMMQAYILKSLQNMNDKPCSATGYGMDYVVRMSREASNEGSVVEQALEDLEQKKEPRHGPRSRMLDSVARSIFRVSSSADLARMSESERVVRKAMLEQDRRILADLKAKLDQIKSD